MDNFKKVLDLDGLTPEPMIRSGDTGQRIPCFGQLSIDPLILSMKSMIDHNIAEQSVFSWAPKVVRKCESKHWFSFGVGIQTSCIAG